MQSTEKTKKGFEQTEGSPEKIEDNVAGLLLATRRNLDNIYLTFEKIVSEMVRRGEELNKERGYQGPKE